MGTLESFSGTLLGALLLLPAGAWAQTPAGVGEPTPRVETAAPAASPSQPEIARPEKDAIPHDRFRQTGPEHESDIKQGDTAPNTKQDELIDNAPKPGERVKKVDHFLVEGNTLLTEAEIRALLVLYEGKTLSLNQMKEVAADLTSLYQRKGYYLVRAIIPVQSFATSDVTIKVVQGKIGKVKVEGAQHYDPNFIRRRFETAVSDGNFRASEFSRTMILMNELPDLEVKAIFAPGEAPGTTDVTLKTKDTLPLHFGVDYNNYGTAATGQNRVGLDLEVGNIGFQGDEFSARGVLGFPSENNKFYQLGYSTPIDLQGTTASFSYANGAFAVSEGLGQILDIRGNANIFTLAFAHPLERDLDFSSNLGLAISHKNITNNFFGGASPFSHDEYTMTKLTYSADWRGPSGRTILQAAWSQGFGGTPDTDPLVSRKGANGHFSRFNVDIARIQRIQEGLYGVLRGSVQYATTPLYVGEQFAVGGPDTVRGYPQAGLLGDNAYLVGAELRWSPFPSNLDGFQVNFFIDHGGVGLNRPQAGDLAGGNSLTGAGLGFRWQIWEHTNLRVDLGFPIAPRNDITGKNPAVYLGLQTRY